MFRCYNKKVKLKFSRYRPGVAQRVGRGIALLSLDHGTGRGWGVRVTLRPFLTPGKDAVLIVQEAGWTPGSVWTGAENLAPTGIRSPDRPARSDSLYQLRYPAQKKSNLIEISTKLHENKVRQWNPQMNCVSQQSNTIHPQQEWIILPLKWYIYIYIYLDTFCCAQSYVRVVTSTIHINQEQLPRSVTHSAWLPTKQNCRHMAPSRWWGFPHAIGLARAKSLILSTTSYIERCNKYKQVKLA